MADFLGFYFSLKKYLGEHKNKLIFEAIDTCFHNISLPNFIELPGESMRQIGKIIKNLEISIKYVI